MIVIENFCTLKAKLKKKRIKIINTTVRYIPSGSIDLLLKGDTPPNRSCLCSTRSRS